MVWRRRAQEHAHRNCRQAQQGDQRGTCRSVNQDADSRPGQQGVCKLARRLRQVHCQRNRETGQSGQVRRREAGLTTVVGLGQSRHRASRPPRNEGADGFRGIARAPAGKVQPVPVVNEHPVREAVLRPPRLLCRRGPSRRPTDSGALRRHGKPRACRGAAPRAKWPGWPRVT